jgi:hypothetical protein
MILAVERRFPHRLVFTVESFSKPGVAWEVTWTRVPGVKGWECNCPHATIRLRHVNPRRHCKHVRHVRAEAGARHGVTRLEAWIRRLMRPSSEKRSR